MSTPRYQDFVDELALGQRYGIFIDDSGSPGMKNTPANVHPERKSWVAVVVSPELMSEVLKQFPQAIDELRHTTGATEFHFRDIYAGDKQFKGVGLQVRLAMFEFMAHLFAVYRFPIIVQTLDPVTLTNLRSRSLNQIPDRLEAFDFTKPEDTALFFLLVRLKWFMQKTATYPNITARVFIDEGFKKNGIAIKIPAFESVFADGMVCFASSASLLPIQLADFAAFALNRSQLIGGKASRGSLDDRLLEILSPVAWNYQDIEQRIVSLSTNGPLIQ